MPPRRAAKPNESKNAGAPIRKSGARDTQKKRERHNMSESRRRIRIRNMFDELKAKVDCEKKDRYNILQAAAAKIDSMTKLVNSLSKQVRHFTGSGNTSSREAPAVSPLRLHTANLAGGEAGSPSRKQDSATATYLAQLFAGGHESLLPDYSYEPPASSDPGKALDTSTEWGRTAVAVRQLLRGPFTRGCDRCNPHPEQPFGCTVMADQDGQVLGFDGDAPSYLRMPSADGLSVYTLFPPPLSVYVLYTMKEMMERALGGDRESDPTKALLGEETPAPEPSNDAQKDTGTDNTDKKQAVSGEGEQQPDKLPASVGVKREREEDGSAAPVMVKKRVIDANVTLKTDPTRTSTGPTRLQLPPDAQAVFGRQTLALVRCGDGVYRLCCLIIEYRGVTGLQAPSNLQQTIDSLQKDAATHVFSLRLSPPVSALAVPPASYFPPPPTRSVSVLSAVAPNDRSLSMGSVSTVLLDHNQNAMDSSRAFEQPPVVSINVTEPTQSTDTRDQRELQAAWDAMKQESAQKRSVTWVMPSEGHEQPVMRTMSRIFNHPEGLLETPRVGSSRAHLLYEAAVSKSMTSARELKAAAQITPGVPTRATHMSLLTPSVYQQQTSEPNPSWGNLMDVSHGGASSAQRSPLLANRHLSPLTSATRGTVPVPNNMRRESKSRSRSYSRSSEEGAVTGLTGLRSSLLSVTTPSGGGGHLAGFPASAGGMPNVLTRQESGPPPPVAVPTGSATSPGLQSLLRNVVTPGFNIQIKPNGKVPTALPPAPRTPDTTPRSAGPSPASPYSGANNWYGLVAKAMVRHRASQS